MLFPPLLMYQKFFKGPVMYTDMFKAELADFWQPVRQHVLARAEEMAHLGGVGKNRIVVKTVLHRLQKQASPRLFVLLKVSQVRSK